jgi:hypothetical protein
MPTLLPTMSAGGRSVEPRHIPHTKLSGVGLLLSALIIVLSTTPRWYCYYTALQVDKKCKNKICRGGWWQVSSG